jgi:crotonobetainyl-CoA:carnitine CoA-transferase CaiB-like acyl-CoA transferase
LRVVDLSTHACGPFAGEILASLGAAVIKVEQPDGDPERRADAAMFLAGNRGKFSVALDLKSGDDVAVAHALLAEADVAIEGFRPGVAERLGIDFERVRARRPTVIYVSLPGFGSTGPYAHRRGYDTQFRALTGDLYFSRDAAGVPQYADTAPVLDYAAAMYAVIGVLAVLRDPDHGPVHLEVPIVAAGLAWNFPRLIDPDRAATAGGLLATSTYRTRDDRFLILSPGLADDDRFARLCAALGRPDLATGDERATADQRRRSAPKILAEIASAMWSRSADEWVEALEAADVPYAVALTPDEVVADPHVRSLAVLHDAPSPWASFPIRGLACRDLVALPRVDEHGAIVRDARWSGVEALVAHSGV